MGLLVYVARTQYGPSDFGDTTNGGMSAEHNTLCVVNLDGPFEPREHMPAAMLSENAFGEPIIVPAELVDGVWRPAKPEGMVGPMMGGNFASTSDSRFKVGFYGAVPIHDRFETPAQYRALSV